MSSRYCEWAAMLETIGSRLNVNIPQMHFGCAWSSLKYAEWKKKEKLVACMNRICRVSKVALIKFLKHLPG